MSKVVSLLRGLLALLIAQAVNAAQIAPAKVQGELLDPYGKRIVNAAIILKNPELKRVARADEKNEFSLDVPPGTYQLTVEVAGVEVFRLENLPITGQGIHEMQIWLGIHGTQIWVEPEYLSTTPTAEQIIRCMWSDPLIETVKAPLSEKIEPRKLTIKKPTYPKGRGNQSVSRKK